MELLIFSDSHGNTSGMRRVLSRQISYPDAICFLGDGLADAQILESEYPGWYCVRGNCDWGSVGEEYPTERILTQEGHKLLLTHGHTFSVKSSFSALLSHAVELGADIILYGHTHEPMNQMIAAGETLAGVCVPRDTYLFNPGSIGKGGHFGTLFLRGGTVLFSHGSIYGGI